MANVLGGGCYWLMSSERLLRRVCVVGHRCSLLSVFTCAFEVYVSFPVPAGSVGGSASCVSPCRLDWL